MTDFSKKSQTTECFHALMDALDIQFRKLPSVENYEYGRLREQDFFNTVNDIHDDRTDTVCQTQTCKLEYGIVWTAVFCYNGDRYTDIGREKSLFRGPYPAEIAI